MAIVLCLYVFSYILDIKIGASHSESQIPQPHCGVSDMDSLQCILLVTCRSNKTLQTRLAVLCVHEKPFAELKSGPSDAKYEW